MPPSFAASRPSPDRLPVEIAFLVEAGVSPRDLRLAARHAERWRVFPEEAVISTGLLSEDLFARALARHLRLPVLPPAARAIGPGTMAEVVGSGLCRVGGAGPAVRFALAPRGPRLRHLLERPRADLSGLAITTPARLRRLVREAHGGRLAYTAANALADAAPASSARNGLGTMQVAALALLCALFSFHIVLTPLATLVAGMASASAPFFGLVFLRLAAAFERHPVLLPHRSAHLLRDGALPVYTVLVPLYRESRVLPQLIGALTDIDYPPALLDVKILVEDADTETRAACAALDLPAFIDVVVVPEGHPRTKPRALNLGLMEALGELVVVYDAEDIPHPLQLRWAASLFAQGPANLACLQARLAIDNTQDSWLTRLFTVEYAQLFDVLNPMLAANDLPVPLGGTSNHFRVAALREVGGWDAWNVTEDADLGLRLATHGFRVGDLPLPTLE